MTLSAPDVYARDPAVGDVPALTEADAEKVRLDLAAHLEAVGRSLSDVARACDVSASTLSYFMRRRYCGNWRRIAWRVADHLLDENRRRGADRPRFVETRVAAEVLQVAGIAQHLEGIGLIYGPSGLGKTSALAELERRDEAAVIVRLETAATSAGGVIETVARAFKLYPPSRRTVPTREAMHAIKQRIAERETLLLIDEAHKLLGTTRDRGLHTLRDLHDSTGVPMLWCSTVDVRTWLERNQTGGLEREPLAQIRSRIAVGRDLMHAAGKDGPFTAKEVRQLFDGHPRKLTPPAARDLAELANLPDGGHLRACAAAVKMASRLVPVGGELTSKAVRDVMGLLVNSRGASHLSSFSRTEAAVAA
jgi:DNA transposition AAA+ family ATPase